MATFYVPPAIGVRLIVAVARKGISELWLNPGSESVALGRAGRSAGPSSHHRLQHHGYRRAPLRF